MKFAYFLVFAFFLLPQSQAQIVKSQFPDDYFGLYKGALNITTKAGNSTVNMEFRLEKTDSIGRYLYQIVYLINGKRQERNYTLIAKDLDSGDFVIDENNGILLSAKLYSNQLFSVFAVQGNLIQNSMEFHEDFMIFQNLVVNQNDWTKTEGESKNNPEVSSYAIASLQRAKLIKQQLQD